MRAATVNRSFVNILDNRFEYLCFVFFEEEEDEVFDSSILKRVFSEFFTWK